MPGRVIRSWETFEQRDGERNDQRQRTYTRTFMVETNSRTCEQAVVLLAPAIPRVWHPYIGQEGFVDMYSWCRSIQAHQDTQNPYLWHITCRYDSKLERPDINQIELPTLRPAEIEWDTVTEPRVCLVDRNGDDIQNSAGDYFDPPVTKDARILQLTVVKNQVDYNALLYLGYHDAVNEDAFLGFQPGRVRCCLIKGKRAFEAGAYYWQVTYVFQIRKQDGETDRDLRDRGKSYQAWAKRILDAGYRIKASGAETGKRPFIEQSGRPATTPVLLDGNGGALAANGDPVYLYFHIYEKRKFRDLYLL